MRTNLAAAFVGVAVMALSARADASSSNGTVTELEITSGSQYAIVRIYGNVSGTRPACHVGGLQQTAYSIDLNTVKGRALLTTLTAVQLAGRAVSVVGSGVCLSPGSPYSAIESIGRLTSYE